MSTIVLHVEDKVSTDFVVVFRNLTSAYAFETIILVLFIYLQCDAVRLFVIAIFLICANNMIAIIVTRDLIPKFMFWRSSLSRKFGLIL